MSDRTRVCTDPRWLAIGQELGCAPGIVALLWHGLLEHAQTTRPRGGLRGFDLRSHAVFWGHDEALLCSAIASMRHLKLIIDDRLADHAPGYRPPKNDRTAADRQRRLRERRSGVTPVTRRDDGNVTPVTAVTPVTCEGVTPCHAGGDYRGGAVGRASPARDLDSPHHRFDDDARANADDVMRKLVAERIIGTWMQRWRRSEVEQLTGEGFSLRQLDIAIVEARRIREVEGSSQPINIGLLRTLIRNMRPPASSRAATSSTRSVAGHSPAQDEDPLANAINFARQMLNLGAITPEECDRQIAAARAKFRPGGAPA